MSLLEKIRKVCKEKGVCHLEKDLGFKLDFHSYAVVNENKEEFRRLMIDGLIYSPRLGWVKPTSEL